MLVLARKPNESIMIGDNVEIVVVSVQGDQVKLGIKAPRSVAVHRKEIYEEIQRENIAAAASAKAPEDLGGFLKKKTSPFGGSSPKESGEK